MREARTAELLRITIRDGRTGVDYVCANCSADVRYNSGSRPVRRGRVVVVDPYFKLRPTHVHSQTCAFNVEGRLAIAVRAADPDAVRQLAQGKHELRLLFPEEEPSDTAVKAPPSGSGRGRHSRVGRYVSRGKLASYLNTAQRILAVRRYCEEHRDIEQHLVLSFGGRRVRWTDFYFDEYDYDYVYETQMAGGLKYPLALNGRVKEIKKREPRNDATRPYWVVQLHVPRAEPDEDGVVTKVDAHILTSREELVTDLRPHHEVLVFGEWRALPAKQSPNRSSSTTSRIRSWRDLPLRFRLSHPKQVVRVE